MNKKTPKGNGKCIHYSGVDKGFYCWKCMQFEIERAKRKMFLDLTTAYINKTKMSVTINWEVLDAYREMYRF